MSTFRNVSDGERTVFIGLAYPQLVQPDAVVTIDSADDSAYECQPWYWQRVETSTPAPDSGIPTVSIPAPAEETTPDPEEGE